VHIHVTCKKHDLQVHALLFFYLSKVPQVGIRPLFRVFHSLSAWATVSSEQLLPTHEHFVIVPRGTGDVAASTSKEEESLVAGGHC
jgi:hypothetical protein